MKATETCKKMIKKYEGCRLKSYKCQAGIYTIGYGHTKGVQPNQKITQEQAEEFFENDIINFEKYVEELQLRFGYHFNQNQFDALVSFFFNLGKNGTKLTNFGKRTIDTVGNKMLEYCKFRNSKGEYEVSKGLMKRRQEEHKLFFTDYEPTEGLTEVKESRHPTIRKAMYFSRQYSTGKKIRIQNVVALCSDNAITPISYLDNETVTFYGMYNKDVATQYLLVKTSTGKTGYIKNLYIDL
jgi:lysozyme